MRAVFDLEVWMDAGASAGNDLRLGLCSPSASESHSLNIRPDLIRRIPDGRNCAALILNERIIIAKALIDRRSGTKVGFSQSISSCVARQSWSLTRRSITPFSNPDET
jgi:hypothetical protein